MLDLLGLREMGILPYCIEEIKLASKNGVSDQDIESFMVDHDFDNLQLREIRLGLEAGIDVSNYSRPNIPSDEMAIIRERLIEEKSKINEEEIKEKKLQQDLDKQTLKSTKLKNTRQRAGILFVLVLIVALGTLLYTLRNQILKTFEELVLELPESIELSVDDKFNPKDYVLNSSEGEDIIIVYPTFINDTLGDYDLEYVLTNGVKTIRNTLHVSVYDKTAPEIKLKESELSLIREVDEFDPSEHILMTSDNYDKELDVEIDELDWELDEQTLTYKVKDSSGNETSATLQVTITDKPKPVKNPTTSNTSQNSGTTPSGNSGYSDDSRPSGGNGSSSNTPSSNPTPTPQPQPQPSTQPYINGVHSISVSCGSSVGDLYALLTMGIDASSRVTITHDANLSAPGTYTAYYYGDDGATASCSITVSGNCSVE